MSKTFKLNDKTYNVKPFTFNLICDMEDLGFSLENLFDRPMNLVRIYLALCGNMTIEDSGTEVEKAMIKGESIEEVFGIIQKEIEESDFFRALNKTEEEETPESPRKQTTAKKSTTK